MDARTVCQPLFTFPVAAAADDDDGNRLPQTMNLGGEMDEKRFVC